MRQIQTSVLALPLVVLWSCLVLADEPASIQKLQQNGLTRSGRYFVLDDERAVLEKLRAVRPMLASHAAVLDRKQQAEARTQQMAEVEETRKELQARLTAIGQEISQLNMQQANSFPPGGSRQYGGNSRYARYSPQANMISQLNAQRSMIQANLATLNESARVLKAESSRVADAKTLDSDAKASLETLKTTIGEIRPAADAVLQRYETLAKDSVVKSAMSDANRDLAANVKLGPSDTFQNAIKTLEGLERKVLAKRPASASKRTKAHTRH